MFAVTILGNNSALPAYDRHPTAQVVTIDDQLLLAMIKEFFEQYDYYKFTGATFDRHAALKLINLTEDILYGLNAEQHKQNNTGQKPY